MNVCVCVFEALGEVLLPFLLAVQHAVRQFPDRRAYPCSLQWELGALTTGLPGNTLGSVLSEHLDMVFVSAVTLDKSLRLFVLKLPRL